jgi:hypothetical protein
VAIALYQDVRRFDIAVDDAVAMNVVDRADLCTLHQNMNINQRRARTASAR